MTPNHIDDFGLTSRPDLALRLIDIGFQFDAIGFLQAQATVSFLDCGPAGVQVDIKLASGAWLMFTVPAHVDAFTAAEQHAMESGRTR